MFIMMSLIHVVSLGFWTIIKLHLTDEFAIVGCTDNIRMIWSFYGICWQL